MPQGYFFSFNKMDYVKADKPEDCILCRIRNNHPDSIDLTVHRDRLFLAAVNLYPYNPGHLMIFPSRHIVDIREYTQEEQRHLDVLARSILDILDRLYSPAGYNIGYNMGLPAGASISHLHLHVIPRYPSELGVADLLGGKRVLVEDPRETCRRISEGADQDPGLQNLRERSDPG